MPLHGEEDSLTRRSYRMPGRLAPLFPSLRFSLVRCALVVVAALGLSGGGRADDELPPGFTSLFNGKDFTNWRVPEGDNGHWKVIDGVIDCDAMSEAREDTPKDGKSLWTERE